MSFEGEQLKALRAKTKITQQELSERSGIDREKIAKIETGARRMSATDAAYLAHGLGIRADALIARPKPLVRWRMNDAAPAAGSVEQVGEWFADFVEDALYVERRIQRYGLE